MNDAPIPNPRSVRDEPGPRARERRLMAFLDESGSDQRVDPGTYILAAAVCSPDAAEDVREQMLELRLRGQVKLHWRDESDKRRLQVTEAIARLDMVHLVVVRDGTTAPAARPERRRRACLERMLFELDRLDVARAVFESRGRADDGRDRRMLDAMRARRILGPGLRVDHVRGPDEPLLWVPDALCGAVTQDRTGEPAYLETLGTVVEVHLLNR